MSSRVGPILIVEDIPHILELLEVTLKFKGYEVVILEDGHTGGQNGRIAAQQNEVWTAQRLAVIKSSELDWGGQCVVSAEAENEEL